MAVDINREIEELRGVFPNIGRESFYELDNGNVGAILNYRTDSSQVDDFQVLLEYPPGYSNMPPKAWIMEPDLRNDTPHVWGTDDEGKPMICFIDPDDWYSSLTSYDAVVMIKSWVYAYCNWVESGNWAWDEKAHGQPNSSVFDLLPF